jgi:hypothetical protein
MVDLPHEFQCREAFQWGSGFPVLSLVGLVGEGVDAVGGAIYAGRFHWEFVGWAEGFEPSTTGTTIRRSTKLSYAHRERTFSSYQSRLARRQPRVGLPQSL